MDNNTHLDMFIMFYKRFYMIEKCYFDTET